MGEDYTRGTLMVIAERREQIELHRHGAEDDDAYHAGELLLGASAYIDSARDVISTGQPDGLMAMLSIWPWGADGFKPSNDPRKDLAKAAAFLIAEIDRITRFVGERRGPDLTLRLAEAARG